MKLFTEKAVFSDDNELTCNSISSPDYSSINAAKWHVKLMDTVLCMDKKMVKQPV